jgi:hypothetical protein
MGVMDQALNFVTFATRDLAAARAFYANALGWSPLMDVPGEIIFFQVAPGLVLGLFDADKFNEDLATGEDRSRVSGVTLARNVASPEAVVEIVRTMGDAGGTILKAPQPGAFGGVFHALVEDPNGIVWEVAHNPGWRVDDGGAVVFG